MDLPKLKEEIVRDPKGYGYASKTDAQIAGALNERSLDGPVSVRITTLTLQNSLPLEVSGSILAKLEALATVNVQVRYALKALTFYGDGGGLDTAAPNLIAMIRLLASEYVSDPALRFSAEEAAALLALGRTKISRADQLGLGGVVKAADVQQAKGL